MKIILNGKETEVAEGVTISQLLEERKIVPQMIACEVNSEIVRRREYAQTMVRPGDRVEILQMIGGG